MGRNNELERMKKWANGIDIAVQIIGILVQVGCAISAVLLTAMHFFAVVPEGRVDMNLRVLGRRIEFNSISSAGQTVVILVMIAVCIFSIFMIRDLVQALHNVFQPMAKGRPFEEEAVKGFRRAAIWCFVIAVLSMNGFILVIAALLLLLSYVFHYGTILQTKIAITSCTLLLHTTPVV